MPDNIFHTFWGNIPVSYSLIGRGESSITPPSVPPAKVVEIGEQTALRILGRFVGVSYE